MENQKIWKGFQRNWKKKKSNISSHTYYVLGFLEEHSPQKENEVRAHLIRNLKKGIFIPLHTP